MLNFHTYFSKFLREHAPGATMTGFAPAVIVRKSPLSLKKHPKESISLQKHAKKSTF